MRTAIVLLLVVFLAPGCSDDDGGSGPLPAGDFSGSWEIVGTVTQKAAKTCEGSVGEIFLEEFVVTQEGDIATLVLDESRSVEMKVTGNSARGDLVVEEEGTTESFDIRLSLSRDGVMVEGSSTYGYDDGSFDCTEKVDLVGIKQGTEPSGPFNGYWSLDGEIVEDDCGFVDTRTTCGEILQFDSFILLEMDDTYYLGTASRNTATFPLDAESDFLNVNGSIVVTINPEGDAMAGTQAITLSNPSNPSENCSTEIAVTGIRVTGCTLSRGIPLLDLSRR